MDHRQLHFSMYPEKSPLCQILKGLQKYVAYDHLQDRVFDCIGFIGQNQHPETNGEPLPLPAWGQSNLQ